MLFSELFSYTLNYELLTVIDGVSVIPNVQSVKLSVEKDENQLLLRFSVSRRAAVAAGGRWGSSRRGPAEGRDARGRGPIPGRTRTPGPRQCCCGDHSRQSGCETEGSSPETTPLCPEGGEEESVKTRSRYEVTTAGRILMELTVSASEATAGLKLK